LFASIRRRARFLSSLWLLLSCTLIFCSNALCKPLFGAEQPARQREFWTRIAAADVIYIGETHDNNRDHEYELELIRGMIRRLMHFAMGWEMFERTQQRELDRFNERRLSLAELLARTGFEKSWGSYSPLYARILEATAQARIPNIGLNASTALAHKIAKGDPLSLNEKRQIPKEFRVPAGAYRHFVQLLGKHPGMNQDNLDRFFAAQNLWDQTMARTILEFQQKNPTTKLLVLTGRGHVEGPFGVPNYVRQKSSAKQLVLLP
jgi:uncharacterized iron-regulated protein